MVFATALTPALSPRRGRIIRLLTENQAAGFAGRSIAKPETYYGCSLSPGERVRVRASVKTNLGLRRNSVLCLTMVTLMAAFVGCGRGPQFLSKIQTAGGAEALKKECADLVSEFKNTRPDFVDATNYPPIITKLTAQTVGIKEQDSFAFVDIQITGGFSHSGLLVAAQPLPPNFVPLKGGGGNWRVWKLADGVFEYRE